MAGAAMPFEVIRDTAVLMSGLANELPDLLPLDKRVSEDAEFMDFVLQAWARLLSDTHVQELFASETTPNFTGLDGQTFPPRTLTEARFIAGLIRESLTGGEFTKALQSANDLFGLYGDWAARLREQAKIPVSSGLRAVLEEYEYMRRSKEVTDLKRQAEEVLASTRKSASKASKAATHATQAAGTAGEGTLESYFEKFATDEWKSATKFRKWTIILLAVGGVLAAVFLLLPALGINALNVDAGDYVHLAQRVLVTGAVFALAAYLARQSHQHRTLANWAKALSVQLKTFEAFLAPLDATEAKEALRAQFASRVFGEPPVLRGDTSSGDSSAVPDKLWEILSKGFGKSE